jgi:hypothetical protein
MSAANSGSSPTKASARPRAGAERLPMGAVGRWPCRRRHGRNAPLLRIGSEIAPVVRRAGGLSAPRSQAISPRRYFGQEEMRERCYG